MLAQSSLCKEHIVTVFSIDQDSLSGMFETFIMSNVMVVKTELQHV